MRMRREKQKNTVFLVAFLLAVFFGTWLLTKMTPLVGDDFNYAFSWADDTRVDNFTLVVKSMISHRMWTHGRVFAQGWVTLFMMWPRLFQTDGRSLSAPGMYDGCGAVLDLHAGIRAGVPVAGWGLQLLLGRCFCMDSSGIDVVRKK